jgi:hypothetical protein
MTKEWEIKETPNNFLSCRLEREDKFSSLCSLVSELDCFLHKSLCKDFFGGKTSSAASRWFYFLYFET